MKNALMVKFCKRMEHVPQVHSVLPTMDQKRLMVKIDVHKNNAEMMNSNNLMVSVLLIKIVAQRTLMEMTQMVTNVSKMTAQVKRPKKQLVLMVSALRLAQINPKKRLLIMLSFASKIHAMHSKFSNLMVNARNAVPISGLKITTLHVKLKNSHALIVNGDQMMVHAKLAMIT